MNDTTRSIHTHELSPLNNRLTLTTPDNLGGGGAPTEYRISGFNTETNAQTDTQQDHVDIVFQDGNPDEVGFNGTTHEVYLAVLIDRLDMLNKGSFPSRENAIAKTKLEEALMWLKSRTQARMARGVEGQQVK